MKKYLEMVKPWKLVIMGVILFFMYFDSLFGGGAMAVILGILGVLAAALCIAYPFIKGLLKEKARSLFEIAIYVCYPFVLFMTYLFTTIAAGRTYQVLEWIIVILIMIILICFVVINLLDFFKINGLEKLVRFSILGVLGVFAFLLIFRVDGSFRTIGGIQFAEIALYAVLANIILCDKPVLPEDGKEEKATKEEA